MKTRGGDGHLHAQERASGGPALPTAGSGIPASRPGESNCLLFKLPRLWAFVPAAAHSWVWDSSLQAWRE